MIHRTGMLLALFACASLTLLNTGISKDAYADQDGSVDIQQQAPKKIYGKVTDIIEAAGYTYAELDTGEGKVWAAGPNTSLTIGDMIAFTTEMPMKNFHSNSLQRDFPIIYFVNRFSTDNAGPTATSKQSISPHGSSKPASAPKAVEGVNKVEGGNTIAEVYSNKEQLNGNAIRVRGKVTKFTANVMGKNWLHIRDSSSLEDLTVTTDGAATVDTVVVIEGNLAVDKDFGYGYVYPLIVEDAGVTKE